jgi:hypothetical protein
MSAKPAKIGWYSAKSHELAPGIRPKRSKRHDEHAVTKGTCKRAPLIFRAETVHLGASWLFEEAKN